MRASVWRRVGGLPCAAARHGVAWQCPAAPLLIASHHAHSGWAAGPKLRNRRFSTAAGVVDGCVYVTGGYDGSYLKVRVLQVQWNNSVGTTRTAAAASSWV